MILGKSLRIYIISYLAVKAKLATLSPDLNWNHILGISLLGGIGFTMSIFVTNLAFADAETIAASKMSIILASLVAAFLGLFVLKAAHKRNKNLSSG